MTKEARFALISLGVTCCFLGPNEVWAIAANHGVIGIINLESPAAGTIKASGTYTADSGWTITSITLFAAPAGGGLQSSQSADYGEGNWGDASISALTTGVKYNVFIQMTLSDNEGNTQTINGPIFQMKPK